MNAIRRLLYHATLALGPFLLFLAIAGTWLRVHYDLGEVEIGYWYKYGASLCRTEPLLPGLKYGLAVNYDDRTEVVGRVWRIDAPWLFGYFACYPVLTLIVVVLNSMRRRGSRSRSAISRVRTVLHSVCLAFSTIAIVTILAVAAADRVLDRVYAESGGPRFDLDERGTAAFVPIAQADESATNVEWTWPPRESLFDRIDLIFIERLVFGDYVFINVIMSLWPFAVLLTLCSVTALIRGPARRAYRSRRGLCLNCGYDLTGNVTGRCPECGVPAGEPAK